MADERNYYVLCSNNCKFEGMTKEQILAAIEQAVSTGEIKDVDAGFVTKIKEQNAATGLSFWVGTQAEYNALTEKVANCFYLVTDDTTFDDIKTDISTLATDLSTLWGEVQEQKNLRGALLFEKADDVAVVGSTIKDIDKYSLVEVRCGTLSALCNVVHTSASHIIRGMVVTLVGGISEGEDIGNMPFGTVCVETDRAGVVTAAKTATVTLIGGGAVGGIGSFAVDKIYGIY